jgi:hypothetical protein
VSIATSPMARLVIPAKSPSPHEEETGFWSSVSQALDRAYDQRLLNNHQITD